MSAQVRQGGRFYFEPLGPSGRSGAGQRSAGAVRDSSWRGNSFFHGRGTFLGALHFALERAGRSWGAGLVECLKFVTQVLGNAIVRNIRRSN